METNAAPTTGGELVLPFSSTVMKEHTSFVERLFVAHMTDVLVFVTKVLEKGKLTRQMLVFDILKRFVVVLISNVGTDSVHLSHHRSRLRKSASISALLSLLRRTLGREAMRWRRLCSWPRMSSRRRWSCWSCELALT